MHWKCRTSITCAYVYTHTHARWGVVCVCVCIFPNVRSYCTGRKHQRLLLALQSVPPLWMSGPTNACSSLSDCPAWNAALPTLVMMNCSTDTLPVLVMTRCLKSRGLFACSRCLLCQIWPQECEASGLSLMKQRRVAFSLEFAPSIISRGKAGFSLGEVNQRRAVHSRRWNCVNANGLCH